jgi:hypothetical protein
VLVDRERELRGARVVRQLLSSLGELDRVLAQRVQDDGPSGACEGQGLARPFVWIGEGDQAFEGLSQAKGGELARVDAGFLSLFSQREQEDVLAVCVGFSEVDGGDDGGVDEGLSAAEPAGELGFFVELIDDRAARVGGVGVERLQVDHRVVEHALSQRAAERQVEHERRHVLAR